MPLDASPSNELARKLEHDLERQDRLFQTVRESLAQMASETRLSIPEPVLEELDAAFAVRQPPVARALLDCARLRA